MQNLKGKVALVTGSARRIGAVTVRALHQVGATVVVHYQKSSDAAEKLATELNAIRGDSCYLIQAELTDIKHLPAMITQIINEAGRLDILINNASSFYPTPMGEISENDWDNLMGSNLKAPLFLSQAASTELIKNKGCIINMVDIHGMRPLKNHTVYSAAKAGLFMLTQSLAQELGPAVRVNGIAPGAILWPETNISNKEQQDILEKTCLKKTGKPEDIAKAILFLACDAEYITGHIIPVDGGRLLNQ